MLIFLDDIRGSDYMNRRKFLSLGENYPISTIRTAEGAIAAIRSGKVKGISFDHDLGQDLSGYDVAKVVEYLVAKGDISCPLWDVHSANPVGAARIAAAMKSAERLEAENSEMLKYVEGTE